LPRCHARARTPELVHSACRTPPAEQGCTQSPRLAMRVEGLRCRRASLLVAGDRAGRDVLEAIEVERRQILCLEAVALDVSQEVPGEAGRGALRVCVLDVPECVIAGVDVGF